LVNAPVFEGHYKAAGTVIREAGLIVSTLNVIEDEPAFHPFGAVKDRKRSSERLAHQLQMAAAMGAPGILIWDGRAHDSGTAARASDQLAECIGEARTLAGSAGGLEISVELHPFTFALQHRKLNELARALARVNGTICVDFCHFSVALGPGFLSEVSDEVMARVGEIHYCDSDCVTSEFHYPAGRGSLDMRAIEAFFAGRQVPASMDLFQWPFPLAGARDGMGLYKDFVRRIASPR
jgi:sugar phosphate isomerase/epimerase